MGFIKISPKRWEKCDSARDQSKRNIIDSLVTPHSGEGAEGGRGWGAGVGVMLMEYFCSTAGGNQKNLTPNQYNKFTMSFQTKYIKKPKLLLGIWIVGFAIIAILGMYFLLYVSPLEAFEREFGDPNSIFKELRGDSKNFTSFKNKLVDHKLVITETDFFKPTVTLICVTKSETYVVVSHLKRNPVWNLQVNDFQLFGVKNKSFSEISTLITRHDLTKNNPDAKNIILIKSPSEEEKRQIRIEARKEYERKQNEIIEFNKLPIPQKIIKIQELIEIEPAPQIKEYYESVLSDLQSGRDTDLPELPEYEEI